MTLPIVAVSLEDVASDVLVDELRRRGGYKIYTDDGRGWLKMSAASRDVGFHPHWLCKILAAGENPPGLEIDRTTSRRVRAVRISPEFRAWAETRRHHFQTQSSMAQTV